MKQSERLAEINKLQSDQEKARGRVKGFMESTGAEKGVGMVKRASDMVNKAQMPKPTIGQRVKRMTEWFTRP